MTVRKTIYKTITDALSEISELEYIDLYRAQFENPEVNYPDIFTAALIRIENIDYETMTNEMQEGTAEIDILFYCKDGYADQHFGTADAENGLKEIELLDTIVDKLQFLHGEGFSPLEQTSEGTEEIAQGRIMSYRLSFSTMIHRKTKSDYGTAKLNLEGINTETKFTF